MTARKKKSEAPVETPVVEEPAQEPAVYTFKGFDKNLQCRSYQFAVGSTHEHKGKVEACEGGFHACENPWDVLGYYPLVDSDGNFNRFCEVTQSGTISRHGADTKVASAIITVKAEFSLPQWVGRLVDWIVDATKPAAPIAVPTTDGLNDNGGNDAQIGSSGYGARIGSSGNDARIGSSGNGAQIGSSGNDAQIGSSGNGARIGSSGNDARIGSSGYGTQIEATGESAVVACAGSAYRFKLGPNGCIAIPHHDGKRTRFVTLYVGEGGVEAGIWYRLDDAGKPQAA